MPHISKRLEDDVLDAREWSDGEVITELDKMKISLAVDRFWARRGMEGFVERNHRGGVLRTLAKVEELEAVEDE